MGDGAAPLARLPVPAHDSSLAKVLGSENFQKASTLATAGASRRGAREVPPH
jgi:hypothetical protein